MSTLSSPPPPPPPPPLPIQKNNFNIYDSASIKKTYTFSKQKADLEALILLECRKYNLYPTVAYQCLSSVVPQIQDGQTCGMVALSMAISEEKCSCDTLKEIAQERRISFRGEMFSCDWMCQLAKTVGIQCCTLKGGLFSHVRKIADNLHSGGRVLVPYDKDKNHSPGLFEGKSAHWALLTGLVLLELETSNIASDAAASENMACWKLTGFPDNAVVSIRNDQLQFNNGDNDYQLKSAVLYVCAFQGLSKHVKLWPFHELAASNNNLRIADPSKHGALRLPEEGIEGGLCGQAVLLKPDSSTSHIN